MIKICEGCGCDFTPSRGGRQRFHSKKCGHWPSRHPEEFRIRARKMRAVFRTKQSVRRDARSHDYRTGYNTGHRVGVQAGRRQLAKEWIARLRLEHPKVLQLLRGAKRDAA